MTNNLEKLQEILGYTFKNINLLEQALTHVSYANENENVLSYDRLEFLGDATIELIVSSYIFNNLNVASGDLSKLRAKLVSTETLQSISSELQLDLLVKKSKSLPILSKKTMADLFESVVGAVFIDGGFESAKSIVERFVIKDKQNIETVFANSQDYKTALQELMQSKNILFEYKLNKTFGSDHEKTFEVNLYIGGELVSTSTGSSIRQAEENCAKIYLDKNKKQS